MRVNVNEIFTKGGKPLHDFLDYCVRSIQMDLLFIFLVGEDRWIPSGAKAVALYYNFCAPNAPGRVSAVKTLPPYDVRLREAIQPLAAHQNGLKGLPAGQNGPLPPLPAKYLFDRVV